MRARNLFESKPIAFDSVRQIGSDSQSRVFALVQDPNLVAKLYLQCSEEQSRKLAYMVDNPLANLNDPEQDFTIAWPADILVRNGSDGPVVAGLIMPRAINSFEMPDCYTAESRKQHFSDFNHRSLLRVARNLSAVFDSLHKRGIAVGFINESHFQVANTTKVTYTGSDTLQIRDARRTTVYKSIGDSPDFLPAELQGLPAYQFEFRPEHDCFGLAVLIFKLLMEGQHPFSAESFKHDNQRPISDRICAGAFEFAKTSAQAASGKPGFNTLNPEIQSLFVKCFVSGHRDPAVRPTADVWQKALDRAAASIKVCSANRQHCFSNHLQSCPWCEPTSAEARQDLFTPKQVEKQQNENNVNASVPAISGRPLPETLPVSNNRQTSLAANKSNQPQSSPIIEKPAAAIPAPKRPSMPSVESISDYGDGFKTRGLRFDIGTLIKTAAVVLVVAGLLYIGLSGSTKTSSVAERPSDMANSAVSGIVAESIPSINSKPVSMRFYESSIPHKRAYYDRFKQAQTTAISWELGIDYAGGADQSEFTVQSTWFDSRGVMITSQELDCQLPSRPMITYYDQGYAKDLIGAWQPGKYTVEIRVEGTLIAKRSFEIY